MNIFAKRPLLLALFIFTSLTVICSIIPAMIKIIAICVLLPTFCVFLIITLAFAITKRSFVNTFATVLLCLLFSLIAFISSLYFFNFKLAFAESLSKEQNVIAEIKEKTYYTSYISVYTAKIKSINGKNVNFNAEISSNEAIFLEKGQVIMADMAFSPFSESEYGYDVRSTNISNNILTSAVFENTTILETNTTPSVIMAFDNLRSYVSDIIDKSGFDNTASIIKALFIGDQDDISAKTKYEFSRLGISHILSISGTHFTVLLGMLSILLSVLGFNKKIIYLILIPTALFYMGLSGFSFPVCRAGIMSLLAYSGFLLGRQHDTYTSLFIAIALILVYAPYAVLSISLWLSFTATFTILIIVELMGKKLFNSGCSWYKKIYNYVLAHVLISVSISFSTLPITALYFGYISIISPITNLTVVPLFEIFLYFTPFAVIFSNSTFCVTVTEFFGKALLDIVEKIASYDYLLLAVNYNFVIVSASVGIASTLILLACPLKKKWFIAVPAILSVLVIGIGVAIFKYQSYSETSVTYFNTNQSDAVVVTDKNKLMCIDVTNGASQAMYYTQSIVKSSHNAEISAYVFTHCRNDHANMLKRLSYRMKIHKIYLPSNSESTSKKYVSYLEEVAHELGIPVLYYEYGTPFFFEKCEVLIFKPEYLKRTTHEIISFKISTSDKDMLYLGSSFSEGEFDYSNHIKDVEYIILGQHNPIIKKRYFIDTDATLIYGSEEQYNMSDAPNEAYVLNNGGRYHLSLK